MSIKYRCGTCNYVFIPKGGREPKRCPYCSAPTVMIDTKDFIREV